ncbi:MAG: hypothetical protein ABSG54_19035 [Terriglobia bacterium]|jgi:hypothetical protein
MEEKYTLKDHLEAMAIAAFLVGSLVGLVFVFDWLEIDFKWYRFVVSTGFVFGILAYVCAHDLRKIRSFAVFVALISVHIAGWVVYLRSGGGFPRFFIAGPALEVGIGALIMTFVGGVRPRLLRHRRYRPGGEFWEERKRNRKDR